MSGVEALVMVVFGLLGLVVGSFLNVCIDRLPQGESISYPPSHCQSCNHRLAAKDLIPVFSYLWLHGRCRYCQAPIPRRLMWVELATGGLFAFLYAWCGLSAQLGVMLFYTCLFIIVFMIDLERGLILNKVVYPAMAVASLFALFIPEPWLGPWPAPRIANAALGGAVGFGIFFLLAVISHGGMGAGDVKLMALIGLATGFPLVLVAMLIAAIAGGAVAIGLVVARKKSRKEGIPFGPFLSLAALVTLLLGSNMLDWYLGLM